MTDAERIADLTARLEAATAELDTAKSVSVGRQTTIRRLVHENEDYRDQIINLKADADDDCRAIKRAERAEAALAARDAEVQRMTGELAKAQDWADTVTRGKSPCGHWKCYAHTEDGGKHIYCYQCEVQLLKQERDEALREAQTCLNGLDRLCLNLLGHSNGPAKAMHERIEALQAAEAELARLTAPISDAEIQEALKRLEYHHGPYGEYIADVATLRRATTQGTTFTSGVQVPCGEYVECKGEGVWPCACGKYLVRIRRGVMEILTAPPASVAGGEK